MAGGFYKLFSQSFSAVTSVTVVHGLDRLQVAVSVRIGDLSRNDLIKAVTPDPSDPRNAVIITFAAAQTGNVILMDTDHVYSNSPSPENVAALSGGAAMTADVYDPAAIEADAFARANQTGTQLAATISDFDTEVGNNAAVALNTAKVSADGSVTTHNDVSDAGSGAIVTGLERTKLTGIEPSADVTDSTNVAAAGALMISLADAKGDVLVATANDTVIRLPVGTDTHVLTADSTEASGVKWAAGGGGGGGGVYGTEYESELDMTFRSTTSSFEAHKFTTASKPAGTYRIEFNYIWSLDNAASDFRCQVTVDDTTQLYEQTDGGGGSYDRHQQEPKDRDGSGDGGTDQRHVTSYWADVTFGSAGTHEIDIDVATSQSGIAASIHRSTIAIYRVS
jgi:hypothetical protein